MKNSPPALGIATQTQEHQDDPTLDFHNQEIEVKPNSTVPFAIAHQKYFTIIITIL